jgi:DNA-binding CsgD family transcriptional regulator
MSHLAAIGDGNVTPPTTNGAPRAAVGDADLAQAFQVLRRCDSALCLADFKAQVVDALGSVLGFDNVSFFSGPTLGTVFGDTGPVVNGTTSRMLPEYHGRWSQHDIFASPRAVRMLHAGGVASIPELVGVGAVPPGADAYVRHFVAGAWRMETAAAMRIDLFGLRVGLVGIFCADGHALGPRELATLRLLSRQLSAVARGVPANSGPERFRELTDRQREVVKLVASGLNNAQIASTLMLAEDSIKKHINRILFATGCATRIELALLARATSSRAQ